MNELTKPFVQRNFSRLLYDNGGQGGARSVIIDLLPYLEWPYTNNNTFRK